MSRFAITGATGALGRQLVARLAVSEFVERIVVLSRDEHKVRALADRYHEPHQLRWFVGDIRDRQRLTHAFKDVDIVLHCAALKRVDAVVNDSRELDKTNVGGTINVLEAALDCGVRKVMFISSDKATMACNAYGMSKAMAECHTIGFNAYSMPRGMACSAVRYGNCWASTGSVVPTWRAILAKGQSLPLTDPLMTRFHLTLSDAVEFVLSSVHRMKGGEILVPPLPAYRLHDLAAAVLKQAGVADYEHWHRHVTITGLRPGGEKIHEKLLSDEEPLRTLWDRDRYLIMPAHRTWSANPYAGDPVDRTLRVSSDDPSRWISVDELAKLVDEI
jgi:UDP-N-acetylglucosamine 4,6-dehydratase